MNWSQEGLQEWEDIVEDVVSDLPECADNWLARQRTRWTEDYREGRLRCHFHFGLHAQYGGRTVHASNWCARLDNPGGHPEVSTKSPERNRKSSPARDRQSFTAKRNAKPNSTLARPYDLQLVMHDISESIEAVEGIQTNVIASVIGLQPLDTCEYLFRNTTELVDPASGTRFPGLSNGEEFFLRLGYGKSYTGLRLPTMGNGEPVQDLVKTDPIIRQGILQPQTDAVGDLAYLLRPGNILASLRVSLANDCIGWTLQPPINQFLSLASVLVSVVETQPPVGSLMGHAHG